MLHSTESTENNNQSQDILQSSVDQCLLIKNKLLNTASGNDHHIHNIYTNVQTIPDLNESGPLKEITLQSSELDHKQDQPSGQTNDHSDPVDGNLIENPNFKPEGGDVITNMILMTETKTDTDCCKPAVHYDLHKNPMTDDQLQNHTTDTSMNEGEVVDSVRNHEIMIHSDYKENGVSNIQTSLTNDKKIQCFSEAIDMETNCDEKMPAVERLVSDHGENDLQDTRTLLMDDEKEAIDIETKIDEKTLESSSIQTSLMDGEIIETTDMETSVSDHSENGNDLNNAQTSLIDDEQVLVPPLLETDIVENNSIVNCTEQVENFVDNIIEAPESTLSIDGTNTEEEMKNDSRCIIRENTKHGHSNTKDVEIDMGNPQDSADHMIVDTIPALETQLSEEQTVQETVDSVPELDVEKLDRIAADYIIDFQKLSSKEVVSSASKNQKPSRRQSTHQTRSENLRSSSRRKSFHDQKANDKESKESKRPKRRHTLAHTNALKAEPIEPTSEELEQSKSSSVYKPGKWAWTIDKYKTYEERFLLEIEATPDDGKTMTRSRRNQLKNNTKSESPKKIEKRVKKAVKKGKKEILSGDDQFLDIEGDEYGNDSGEVIMSQSQEIHINDIVSEEQTEKENSTPTVEDDQSEKETVEISEVTSVKSDFDLEGCLYSFQKDADRLQDSVNLAKATMVEYELRKSDVLNAVQFSPVHIQSRHQSISEYDGSLTNQGISMVKNHIFLSEQKENENSTPTIVDDQSEKETVEISEAVSVKSDFDLEECLYSFQEDADRLQDSVNLAKATMVEYELRKSDVLNTLQFGPVHIQSRYQSISEYDDILTNLFLDAFFLSFTTHKMHLDFETNYSLLHHPIFDEIDELYFPQCIAYYIRAIINNKITTDDFVALLTDLFFPNGTPIDKSRYLNPEKDARLLENAVLVLKGCLAPNVDRDLKLFGDHCRRYINMYHVRAGYEIDRTFRYKSTDKVEARVRSTRVWENGDEIKFMCGFIVELTPEEEKMLDNRDFSVMYSSKRDANCLFTGPARFVNHDCRANCQFIPAGNGSDEIFFKVKRRIEIGEELTTYYGDNYFGENNCECLCASCELYTTGAFAPKLGTTGVISETLQVRNRPTRGIKSTFSYRDLTKKDLIGLDAKLELEKRKRKAPEGNCEICQTVLDITARPTVFLDTSIMQATHCSRCYRHELIFDIEWPDRKFVHKSSKVRPRVKKQKSTNVVEDEDQEHIQDIKPPSVPSCFVLSKGDSEESLISIVDEIAPEINNEPAPVMENIEKPGKVVNDDKDGHQELNMLIDSPNKIITENQSIPLDSSMPSQDQNASLHQAESIDVVMEDINESKRKSRQSEPNYADSSSDVSADSFTIGNDDDNSMSIGIVKGVVPKMSYVVPRVVWVDPQEDAPFWWPALMVPEDERDHNMPVCQPGETLISYFHTPLEYSAVPLEELRLFNPDGQPNLEFAKHPDYMNTQSVYLAHRYFNDKKSLPTRLKWPFYKG